MTMIYTPPPAPRSDCYLTEDQLKQYEEIGFVVLPSVLDQGDLAGVKRAMNNKVDWMAKGWLEEGLIPSLYEDEPFESRLARIASHLTEEQYLRHGRGWRDRDPGYFDLMSNPKILNAVESLIGPEIFSNPVYNTRPKVPGVAAGAVPWHQDKSYWPDANSNPVITVWVPIVEANLLNGCLHIWPRTHREKVLAWHKETYSGTGFLEIDDEHLTQAEREMVALPVAAGSMILFNDRCIHMSTLNRAETVRWSVDLRYQPTDQDPMPAHGVGFLARSHQHPERVANEDDWLALRPEHEAAAA
ncbi:MAG: phytanoyl-CoA dioxygenase family protein [Planctomycetota bacterium]